MQRPAELSAESLWTEVSNRLRDALSESTFTTWFADTEPIELSGEHLVLAVPNDFTRTWIEDHFLDLIHAAIRETVGSDRTVRLAVRELDESQQFESPPPARFGEGLNPKYTFDLFVIGSSNRFAHAAALAVAEAPARPTTLSSSTAARASERHTSSRRSRATSASTRATSPRAT